ncbi:MAG: asparaginase domain-containing protein, partial [Thaumarchaeota archaeon]|nr:asparaginase domain-containing protein [Nitrososphaerota archaeon]
MPDLTGYRGLSTKVLTDAGAAIGDVLEVWMGDEVVKGTLVPRYEHDDDKHIVIKLKSGYNVGIAIDKISKIVRSEKGEAPKFAAPTRASSNNLPEVSILGTGGTIASRVDYRTGAVRPATTSEELYSLFPELSEIANIKPEIVLSVYSENLEPDNWETMAKKVSDVVARGVSGVLLTMGTDTMGYTAAALSFALRGIPIPLFLVGSQRSSDRPSSDAYLNHIGAATMAVDAQFSGVYVVMHADPSD